MKVLQHNKELVAFGKEIVYPLSCMLLIAIGSTVLNDWKGYALLVGGGILFLMYLVALATPTPDR